MNNNKEYDLLKAITMAVAYKDKGSFMYNNGYGLWCIVERIAKQYCKDHNITEEELDQNFTTFNYRFNETSTNSNFKRLEPSEIFVD